MPGTKSSGRPGGNPQITKFAFKAKGEDPLNIRLSFRISANMKEALDKLEGDRNEFIRNAIAEALSKLESNTVN